MLNMEEKNKFNILTLLLVVAIIVIIIMGYFIYKLYNEKMANNSYTNIVTAEASTELYIVKEIDISSEQSLYNFKTKEWVNEILGAESLYYIALDSNKNLYIVDRFENIVKKLDAQLDKLNIDDTNVDNYVTYANVSKSENALVISTGDDFITFIVNLEDFSTTLAEVNDD
jgi:K+-transporting ATPase A subunit